jgi:hypothetical protein
VTWSVKTPPSKGPATDAIPHIAPMRPKAAGRFASGTNGSQRFDQINFSHGDARGTLQGTNTNKRHIPGENPSGDLQQYAIMTTAPEKIPPVPNPATARPTMRATLVGATPQSREPTSKIHIAVMKVAFICARLAGWKYL